MDNEDYIELKSERWQRIYTLCLFGFVGILVLDSVWLRPLLPERLLFVRATDPDSFWTYLSSGLAFCAFFWLWWRTERYYLRADKEGILQKTGFRSDYVRWQDVFSYRWETTFFGSSKPRLVFRNAGGRVLFRAAEPLVLWSKRGKKTEKQFWEFVENRLPRARRGSAKGGVVSIAEDFDTIPEGFEKYTP